MFHISENTIAVAKNGKWGFINKKNVPCFESENRPIQGIIVTFWAIRR
jgi:hypothetical protein